MDIYFLSAENGLIKIGITKNISQRLGVLSFENASKLELLGIMEGDYLTEKSLQQRFSKDNSHGNWFHPSKDIINFIKNNTIKPERTFNKKKVKKEEKRISRAICLDDWEKQIIYGALLGNAFIVDPAKGLHCYLVIRQSKSKDVNSFLYKTQELRAFSRSKPIHHNINDYRWTSISHQDFDVIKDFCYCDNKKKVTMDWLNVLRDVSLMVWYLDKGFYKKGKFGLSIVNLRSSVNTIKQYFNEVGMSCNLINSNIIFDEKGKEKFLKVIAHRIPEPLRYRLEEIK